MCITPEILRKIRLLIEAVKREKGGKKLTREQMLLLEKLAGETPALPGPGRSVAALTRWTLEVASAEFGIARNTLSKRLKSSGVLPGPDQKFSTGDICRAVFTDGEKARAALALSQKENFDLRNAQLAGTLADVAVFQRISDEMVIVLRQKISEAPIPEEAKQNILREIQNIDVNALLDKTNSAAPGGDLEKEPAPG